MTFNQAERANRLRYWYSQDKVIYEIIRFTKNREVAFLSPVWLFIDMKERDITGFNRRCNRIHNVEHFKQILFNGCRFGNIEGMQQHEFIDDLIFNCYYTLAEYKDGVPFTSLDRRDKENKDIREDYYTNYWKNISSYDFCIDIDAHEGKQTFYWCVESAIKIMIELNKFSIVYYIVFTGNGFQINIPLNLKDVDKKKFSYNPKAERNVFIFFRFVQKLLHDKISNLTDIRFKYHPLTLRKLPYSIVNYSSMAYVSMPINTIEVMMEFNRDKYQMENAIWHIKDFGYRGATYYNINNLNMKDNSIEVMKQNNENFLKFASYLEDLDNIKSKRDKI